MSLARSSAGAWRRRSVYHLSSPVLLEINRRSTMTESSHAAAVVFDRFERVVDPTLYEPLPADDLIGMTDVVNSTEAIKEGVTRR